MPSAGRGLTPVDPPQKYVVCGVNEVPAWIARLNREGFAVTSLAVVHRQPYTTAYIVGTAQERPNG